MCFAFFIATGSFFLGQQDVLPKAMRGSPIAIDLAFRRSPSCCSGWFGSASRRRSASSACACPCRQSRRRPSERVLGDLTWLPPLHPLHRRWRVPATTRSPLHSGSMSCAPCTRCWWSGLAGDRAESSARPASRGVIPSAGACEFSPFSACALPAADAAGAVFELVLEADLDARRLPQWASVRRPSPRDFVNIATGAVLLLVIPWGYVWRRYMKRSGTHWR